MGSNQSKYGVVFLLLSLLIISGIMQTKLKSSPQVFMIILGGITLLCFAQKNKNISTALFYSLVGILLSFVFSMTTVWVLNLIFSESNVIEIEGEKRYVSNMFWLWGISVTIILTPLVLFNYHKSRYRNRRVEVLFLILFVISTTFIL